MPFISLGFQSKGRSRFVICYCLYLLSTQSNTHCLYILVICPEIKVIAHIFQCHHLINSISICCNSRSPLRLLVSFIRKYLLMIHVVLVFPVWRTGTSRKSYDGNVESARSRYTPELFAKTFFFDATIFQYI
jgi:hypothetical protein